MLAGVFTSIEPIPKMVTVLYDVSEVFTMSGGLVAISSV